MKIKRKNLRITDFREEYLPQIEEILKENFRYPWSSQQILSSNPFSVKKVVFYGDEIAGFLFGEVIFSEASITMIAVKKRLQITHLVSIIIIILLKLQTNANI